jgi:hypothetical protein
MDSREAPCQFTSFPAQLDGLGAPKIQCVAYFSEGWLTCGIHRERLMKRLAVFRAWEFGRDDAPTARSMTARGKAPGKCSCRCSGLQGRRIPAPLQGATDRFRTQGVALGLNPSALSAPEPGLCKSEFTWPDDRPFISWRLIKLGVPIAPVVRAFIDQSYAQERGFVETAADQLQPNW